MSCSGGMKLQDMMPTGYSNYYINLILGKQGKQGRNVYLYHQIPVGMIYPFQFGVSNCLVLAWLFDKLGKYRSILFNLCLLPVLAGIFDYCENIGIISLLNAYPHNPPVLSKITDIFTVLKSIFTTLYLIILIFTLIGFILSRISKLVRPNAGAWYYWISFANNFIRT